MKKPFRKKSSPPPTPQPAVQPYIAGQNPPDLSEEDGIALDNECAICFSLQEAATALTRISTNIKMCCQGSSKKKEFGLEKSFVDSQISTIKRMGKFHQYFHAVGESLNDGDFGLHSSNDNPPPPSKFKRFRPQ